MSDFTTGSLEFTPDEARTAYRDHGPAPRQVAPLQGLIVAGLISAGLWALIVACVRAVL